MPPACKRGHPLTEGNVRWNQRADGKPYRICKVCQRLLQKLRYRNDDTYRAAERQRSRNNYHRRQDQHA